MRIVSLDPALTELVQQLGADGELVGISSKCVIHNHKEVRPTIITDAEVAKPVACDLVLQEYLSFEPVDLVALRDCAPDVVLARVPQEVLLPTDPKGVVVGGTIPLVELKEKLKVWLNNDKVKLVAVRATTLESIYKLFEEVGAAIGKAPAAKDRAQRLKSQLMDWADNFYDRTKNKRVTFLSSLDPLKLGGLWIPDLISLCSATSQEHMAGRDSREVSWKEILAFRPDVIIVAPQDMELKESLASFKELSKLPHWEEIPAVIRGEVIFTDGIKHFYSPTSGLIDSMAVLLSAVAGFESGYIATRDTFYRLRWLELHRHRI